MASWDSGLLAAGLALVGTTVIGLVSWVTARLFSHGARISKVETALKPLFDAIDALGTRATRSEETHLSFTKAMGDVSKSLGILDERSFAQGKTLDAVDRKLEQLFSPTVSTPRPRATKA